jgi:hypothetical protein
MCDQIEQLEVCANHAMKEAELLEGQADAIEKEAAHIERVVEKALAVETDEFQIKYATSIGHITHILFMT